jgi:hypothetical protein
MAGLNFQVRIADIAGEVRDGTSRTTVVPVIAPLSSSEASMTTTPSAILWIGYGMSVADMISGGLNEVCAKL